MVQTQRPPSPDRNLPPSKISNPIDNLTPWTWSPSNPSEIPPETITERCLRHRPRKTKPHNSDKRTRRLEIIRQIRVRDGAYAQVVQCSVDGIQGPLVAKIFDPLYRWEDVALDEPQSPVGLTESEWSREAAAYAKIQERGLDGRYTPRFEGCWSFDIPYELELELASDKDSTADHTNAATTTIPGGSQSEMEGGKQRRGSCEEPGRRTIKVTRNVRLLLMECIQGDSMLRLLETGSYRDIPPDVRMDLLGRAGEALSALWHIRVSQGDPYSRNVVVGRYEEHDEVDKDEDVDNVDGAKEEHHPSSSSSSFQLEEGEGRPRKRQKRREGGGQEWHVALIDFGRSVVLDLPNAKSNLRGRLRPALPLPPNPMNRSRGWWPILNLWLGADWDDAAPEEGANWLDKDYDPEARRKWMEARWGKGSTRAHWYQLIEYDKLYNPLGKEK